jgi:hypothetical protein
MHLSTILQSFNGPRPSLPDSLSESTISEEDHMPGPFSSFLKLTEYDLRFLEEIFPPCNIKRGFPIAKR